ncbi:hypothetical protein [Brevundimonas sp.]|uniref:hypothetical protein n=1 Tax=Brevundimonas sp. TaxID=1871086 RepID=UPI0025F93C99|nr:hypothetical protein [Brevundimonas sp.]
MFIAAAVLTLLAADAQPITSFERPETPREREQREEDARNRVTEGERAGDGATPDRMICDWRRIPGSNRRERVCQTAADRRATRDIARETLQQMQGSVTDPVG